MVNALTYNISWATQSNTLAGSEKDFVQMCRKMYKSKGGKRCTKNAIKNIGKLDSLNLVFLQEVNSSIEPSIMKVQSRLKKFKRGQEGLSIVSTLWDPSIFGKLIYQKTFNLSSIKGDTRPCLILVLQSNKQTYILINVHMHWRIYHKQAIKKLENKIKNDKFLNKIFFNEDVKIIIGGDFNDGKTTIHKNNPLILRNRKKTIKLKYKLNKHHSRKTLKSCCWHKNGHKYKYFSDTGDYILVNHNIKQKTIMIPKLFKQRGRINRLYSDHMPVLSSLKL
jgi:endonuclease/exonuclease/phosphatase family metal-dependent hydrolase